MLQIVRNRGRLLVICMAIGVALCLFTISYVCRFELLESWYLCGLESQNADRRINSADKLASLMSVRALPRILELICEQSPPSGLAFDKNGTLNIPEGTFLTGPFFYDMVFIGMEGLLFLKEKVRSGSDVEQLVCLWALAHIENGVKSAQEEVVTALSSKNSMVRAIATCALIESDIELPSMFVTPLQRICLSVEDSFVAKSNASVCLSAYDKVPNEFIDDLIARMNGQNEQISIESMSTIRRIGRSACRAIDSLKALQMSESEAIRKEATFSLNLLAEKCAIATPDVIVPK